MRDYPREVNAAFAARHGDGRNLSSIQRLNIRQDVAKAMLNEHPNLVNELNRRATAQHVAEKNEWNMILEDISLASDVGQYVSTPLISISLTYLLLPGLETTFSTPFSLFFRPSAPTLVATLPSSLEMLRRMIAMKVFSPRELVSLSLGVTPLLMHERSVHWWPGDRSITKDWTRWDEHGFNSGVAGPFLKYAAENSESFRYEMRTSLLTPLSHLKINHCKEQTSYSQCRPFGNRRPRSRIPRPLSTTRHL